MSCYRYTFFHVSNAKRNVKIEQYLMKFGEAVNLPTCIVRVLHNRQVRTNVTVE